MKQLELFPTLPPDPSDQLNAALAEMRRERMLREQSRPSPREPRQKKPGRRLPDRRVGEDLE